VIGAEPDGLEQFDDPVLERLPGSRESWMISASPTIAPTVIRGSSEA